ncbi:MAG TPA: class I SAM-dependent methyltransferase [Longimicrobium sp.]
MASDVPCRVCGSSATEFLCDTYVTDSTSTRLSNLRCGECGSVFIGTRVSTEELDGWYARLDAESYYRSIEEETGRKLSAALRDLGGVLGKDAALLDLGTGNGRFVELAREAGFTNVSAHEIPGMDLSRIRGLAARIFEDHDYASIPDRSFDCVLLLDVAEHVPDVPHLFRTCRRILREGGILYIHTPVVTRVDRLMHRVQRVPGIGRVGRVWQRGRTSIYHLQNYTPRSLRLALGRAGFGQVEIRVINELSWPVSKYIRYYLLERNGLPASLAPLFVPVFYPLFATRTFNANKGVVTAR